MPLFVVTCLDKPDSLELRMATRPAHLEFLTANAGSIKVGGPFLDDAERMVGSLFIVEADDKAAARALAAQDPYAKAGLFASTEVRGWRWVVGAPS